jgi:hypothetical protein
MRFPSSSGVLVGSLGILCLLYKVVFKCGLACYGSAR